jgi:uncharacterized protein (DUF1697 family)
VVATTTFVGFLRAVNVGNRKVAMDGLREAVAALGFSNVRTVLNSGNVVFRAHERDAGKVERRLELGCASPLGLSVEFMVRDLATLEAVIAANPYPEFARNDPGHLLVVFLKGVPSTRDGAAFAESLEGPEEARVLGAHAYVTYPAGIGRSRLTLPRIEAAIGTRGTARNWNTVHRLTELARATDVAREGG